MDLENHPYRTGCIIGLLLGALKYPGALGCAVLFILLAAVLVVAVAVFTFLDWMPYSGLVAAAAVGAWWWARRSGTG